MPVQPWPPTPPVILRSAGHVVAIDLHALTEWLYRQVRIPTAGGSFGNARGARFEDQVQALIDASAWGRLPPELRALRHRTLRRLDGSDITDVDAIGVKDRSLLLVDCLSRVADQDLEVIGDPEIYRKAASRVEDKVAGTPDGKRGWVTKTRSLAGRLGRNFDLRSYDEVVAVVVTPTAVYLERDLIHRPEILACEEAAEGLLFAATYDELREWLRTNA